MSRKEFLKKLPRKRTSAGIFLFNYKNELLILKLGYSKFWNIPGGCIEEGESIVDGLHREIKEEIGIKVNILRCIVIEDKIAKFDDYLDEALQFVFIGKKLSKKDIEKIKIDNDEIIDFEFVKIPEAIKMINPKMAKRLKYLNGNYKDCIVMKNGKKII